MSPAAVAIVGAGGTGVPVVDSLLGAGIRDTVVVEGTVVSAVFVSDRDSWTLRTAEGETVRSRVVIGAADQTFQPWIPHLPGGANFRGEAFHSATVDPAFDPTEKRIAVLGGDAAAGRLINRLAADAACVQIFPLAPRRVVPTVSGRGISARRRLLTRLSVCGGGRRASAPAVVKPAIDAITATGIRTCDGVDHDVDVIVYGTGFSVPAGLSGPAITGARGVTLRQAWQDGSEPYAGVAAHGFPNYFWISRPDRDGRLRYVVECLRFMHRTASTRIEVRLSSQHVYNERVHLRQFADRRLPAGFDLWSASNGREQTYDGAATLTIAKTELTVRVRLTGFVDPLDGQYHWQGTVFGPLPTDVLRRSRQVLLAAGGLSAPARITEQTPQGAHSITGVGAPPFALEHAEAAAQP